MTKNFKPYRIVNAELDNLPIVDGQFIIATDTKKIYSDISDTERISIDGNGEEKIELYPVMIEREESDTEPEGIWKIKGSILQTIKQDIKGSKIKTQMYTYNAPKPQTLELFANNQTVEINLSVFSCQYIVKDNPESSLYGYCYYTMSEYGTSFLFIGEGLYKTDDSPVLGVIYGNGASWDYGAAEEDIILELTSIPADLNNLANKLILDKNFLVKSDILDDSNKIQSALLPSSINNVSEYTSKSNFPTTGETSKIYIDTTTNLIYRWDGSGYVEISQDITYNKATTTEDGLMSKEDKSKLENIAEGAQVNSITGIKGDSEINYRTGNVNITKANIGLADVENKSSETIRGEITNSNVTTALGYTPLNSNEKGTNNGVAELDENGKVLSSQLPSYVDDVLEYTSKSDFPANGESGKIYVDTTANLTYRWTGSAYTEISPSIALGTTSATALRGDWGKTAYDHATNKGSAFASGLYKITTNEEGHVTAAAAVTKDDITSLEIPGLNSEGKIDKSLLPQQMIDFYPLTLESGAESNSYSISKTDLEQIYLQIIRGNLFYSTDPNYSDIGLSYLVKCDLHYWREHDLKCGTGIMQMWIDYGSENKIHINFWGFEDPLNNGGPVVVTFHGNGLLDCTISGDTPETTTITIASPISLQINENSNATTTEDGLMSKEDKSKIDNLATVASSGSYDDLLNKPIIPTSTVELTNDSGYVTKDLATIELLNVEKYAKDELVVESIRSKNMFDKNNILIGGFLDDGSIVGTPTLIYTPYYIKVNPNTVYTFSANSSVERLVICEYDSSKTFIQRNIVQNQQSYTIATTLNTAYVRLNSVLENRDNLQFEKDLETNYSPFQELNINNLKDKELIIGSIKSKNMFDKNNLAQGVITNDRIGISDTRIATSHFIKVKPNTIYTLSFDTIRNIDNINISSFINPSFPRASESGWTDNYTFTTNSTTNYIMLTFRNSANDIITPNDIMNVMLEEGSTATAYLPYQELDANNLKDKELIVGSIKNKNIAIINKVNITFTSYYYKDILICGLSNLKPNTQYTLSYFIENAVEPFNLKIGYGDDFFQEDLILKENNYNGYVECTFTTGELPEKKYLYFRPCAYIAPTTISNCKIERIQLEEGTATNYSPYQNLDSQEIYSTNEIIIGKFIDNKPIYRQTQVTTGNGETAQRIYSQDHIDNIINAKIWLKNGDIIRMGLGAFHEDTSWNSQFYFSKSYGGSGIIECGTNYANFKNGATIYTTLEYTKE